MLALILFAPLLASLIVGLYGRYLGNTMSKIISISLIATAMFTAWLSFSIILNNDTQISLTLLPWINVDFLNVLWSFRLDMLSASMLIPVLTISCLVHIYAYGYMDHDPSQPRFFAYLGLFTFFMAILVSGDNYLILFIGWEYVGVASYLLISFWFTRIQAMKAALSAILLNRMGDSLMVLGIAILLATVGSLNFSTIFSLAPYIPTIYVNLILLCFLIAATAKSAQLGLHSWLLSAMEGPTPVSALLHAATMVTAGIYLLIRTSPVLEYSPTLLLTCLWLGGITTLTAGLIAIATSDIKKVIALSTMSQLAMMMIAIGLSAYSLSLFHLFCHSFFKALLFMSAGAIIHSVNSESQDMRTYGSLLPFLPFTYTAILIASLSLMAIPGLTGFYSKDIILESAIGQFRLSGFIIYWFALASATLTSIYSIRVLYLSFFNIPNAPKWAYLNIHESNWVMATPMLILSFASIFVGYYFRDAFLGMGIPFSGIFIHPNHISLIETEFALTSFYKLLPLTLVIFSSISVLWLFEFNYKGLNIHSSPILIKLFTLLNQRFMFDQLLNNLIIRPFLSLGANLYYLIDQGLLKFIGPFGIWSLLYHFSFLSLNFSYSTKSFIIPAFSLLLASLISLNTLNLILILIWVYI